MRVSLTFLFILLLSACAMAEPEFVYYSSTGCGNDYHTRCEIETKKSGAKFTIFHGFMKMPMVQEGFMTNKEWRDFQKDVVQLDSQPSEQEEARRFLDGGYYYKTPTLKKDALCTKARRDAFAKTKAGKCFFKWLNER